MPPARLVKNEAGTSVVVVEVLATGTLGGFSEVGAGAKSQIRLKVSSLVLLLLNSFCFDFIPTIHKEGRMGNPRAKYSRGLLKQETIC